jgi:uncharacterized protein DUF6941
LDVTLILCDAAQQQGGKLYILGAGWSLVQAPNVPITMALGVIVGVPWDQANDQLLVEAVLMTDDGDPVQIEVTENEFQPVLASGQMEVGRPPGLKRGMTLNAPLAFTFNGVPLPVGGYRWELKINGTVEATAPFRVVG